MNLSRPSVSRRTFWTAVVIALTALLAVGSTVFYFTQTVKSAPSILTVEIQPRKVKLAVGETQIFQAVIYDGVPPYIFEWRLNEKNGTLLGEESSLEFAFEEPCDQVLLWVLVWDSKGNYGDDATYVYDPFSSPDIYLDDLPFAASYVVKTDGSYFWIVEDNGNILANGTNDDSILQGALNNASSDGGGLVFVRRGNYTASITVKNGTVLMLEYGVSGVTYTTEATGIVFKYLAIEGEGYVVLDSALNMTGHQILFGVFHSGSTAPSSPVEAQWFYDTDDHTLYVWNSTAWVNCFEGGVGSTHVAEATHSYTIYKDGSTCYAKNGTTEQNDWSSSTNRSYVIQSAINSLSEGSVFIKAASTSYVLDTGIVLKSNVNIFSDFATLTWPDSHSPIDADHTNLLYYNGASALENVTIWGLRLDGNMYNNLGFLTAHCGYGVRIRSFTRNFRVENCHVVRARTCGISFRACDGDSYNVWALGNTVDEFGQNGIEFVRYNPAKIYDSGALYNFVTHGSDIGLATACASAVGDITYDITFAYNVVQDMDGIYGSGGPPYSWTGLKLEAGVRCTVIGNTIRNVSQGICEHSSYGNGHHIISDNTIILGDQSGAWHMGIYLFQDNNIVTENKIWGPPTDNWRAIQLGSGAEGNIIQSNVFVANGTGNSNGIQEDAGASGNFYYFNDVAQMTNNKFVFSGTNATVKDNKGWNPYGHIANPVSGTNLVDSGSGTIANNTEYTCWQSPKVVYAYASVAFDIYHEEQLVFDDVTVATVRLEPSDTFEVEWGASSGTTTVIGQ